MASRIGLPLAAGLLASLMFLSLARGMPNGTLLAFFSALPLMVAGLGMGPLAALGAVGLGGLAVSGVEGEVFALTYLAMVGLPALVVAYRALRVEQTATGPKWAPPGAVLAWLAMAAVAVFVVVAVLLPTHPDGVKGWMAESLARTLDGLSGELSAEERQQAAQALAGILPAVVMGSWWTMAVINAVLGQKLLVRMARNLRPNPLYSELDLPDWLVGAAVVLGLAAAAGGEIGYIALNMAVVTVLPFSVLGIVVAHRHVASRPGKIFGLVALYGILVLAFVWVLLPAAGLGLARFIQIRIRRRKMPDGGKEE